MPSYDDIWKYRILHPFSGVFVDVLPNVTGKFQISLLQCPLCISIPCNSNA